LEKQLLWDLCERLEQSPSVLELGGTGNEVRDWLHVRDAARLLVCAAEVTDTRCLVLNGGTGTPTSVSEIARRVTRAWGVAPHIAFSQVTRSGDPVSLIADVSRARDLGVEAQISLDQGIPEVVTTCRRQRGAT